MFGKVLYMALQKNMDLQEILKYPLIPIPLSLCHFDGTIRSTKKSALINHLKGRVTSLHPPTIDLYIIDGNFYLHLLGDLPQTFGKISRYILNGICNITSCKRIDIVFDRYETPSIKVYERKMRNNGEACPPY